MIRPVHYTLNIAPDLETFRFAGHVEIDVTIDAPADQVVLDAIDLAVWQCTVKDSEESIRCPFSVEPKKETLTISFPEKKSGDLSVAVDFEGKITSNMSGMYRSRYEAGDHVGYIAVTQFQESDARRAFPCFDRPGQKATFDIALHIPASLTALSNAPVAEETPLPNGKKRVSFARTPKMSTYLVFMGVGPFETIEDSAEVLVRVVTTPGMTDRASVGLTFGRKALSYCQQYFGMPYPFSKLDLIAVEDFAAGAMENWGAITFRENLLLHDPKKTSSAGEQRIYEVIAHEIAHQWFGDLVSPSAWKYLWLNESFATFFAYGVVNHYYPQWDIWGQFLSVETTPALQRDSLRDTCAIEIAGGEHVVINTSTAPIIYNKGASVLRQIKGYIGEETFKKGIQRYLQKHAYACASSRDLWEAFEAVSQVSVSSMMESWIYQPGHPVLKVSRKGDALELRQKRFTFLPNSAEQHWIVPITVDVLHADGRREIVKAIMDDETLALNLRKRPLWYKVNAGQTGFYRVVYEDRDNWRSLVEAVQSGALKSEDRWGLQGDFYAQVMAGAFPLQEYLTLLNHYNEETAFLPLGGITGNLMHAFLVTESHVRERIVSVARPFVDRILSRIGWEPEANEPHTTTLLRDQILWQAVLYDSGEVTHWLMEKLNGLLKGGTVHPDIARSVMQAGALKGDDNTLTWFCEKLTASDSEHERMNVLVALGCFGEPARLDKARQFVLHHVPARNQFVALTAMAANPYALPSMWPWFVENLVTLEGFPPVHFERVLSTTVSLSGMFHAKEVRSFFEGYVEKNQQIKDTASLSLEKMEVNLRLREASSKGI